MQNQKKRWMSEAQSRPWCDQKSGGQLAERTSKRLAAKLAREFKEWLIHPSGSVASECSGTLTSTMLKYAPSFCEPKKMNEDQELS